MECNFEKFADDIYFISCNDLSKRILTIVNIKEKSDIIHEVRFLHTKNCIEQQFFMKTVEISPENILQLFIKHGYSMSNNES